MRMVESVTATKRQIKSKVGAGINDVQFPVLAELK